MLRRINQVTLRSLVVKIPLKRQWRGSRGGINVKKGCQRLQVSFSFYQQVFLLLDSFENHYFFSLRFHVCVVLF